MTLGTLYSNGPLCPFTHRVQIAVAELGAQVDIVYGRDIPASVREANGTGTWPVFVPADGGGLIDDSSKIVYHLIAQSGAAGSAYRSDHDTLAKLDSLVVCISKVIRAGKPAIQREFRGKLDSALAEVEALRAAANGPFLGGDHFSQADGHVAPFLYRLPFLVEIRDHVPPIFLENDEFKVWVDRVVNRSSFRAIAPKRHAIRQFYVENAKYGKPMKVGRLHHSGFRGMWNDLIARTSTIAEGENHGNEALQEARDLCYLLFRSVALHAKFENLILFPALDSFRDDPSFTAEAYGQHEREEHEMNSLLELFDRALDAKPGKRQDLLTTLAAACARSREGQLAHLDYEEAHFMPVLAELELDQHLSMLEGAYEMCILERPYVIGVLASYMPVENILSLLDSLVHAVETDSEQWHTLLSAMHRFLSAEQWLRVVRRFEDVLPTSLMVVPSGHRHETIGSAARALQGAAPIDRIEIPRSKSAS
jgi:glutathione S-transferase